MKKMFMIMLGLTVTCFAGLSAEDTESLPPALLQISNFDGIFDAPIPPEGEFDFETRGLLAIKEYPAFIKEYPA